MLPLIAGGVVVAVSAASIITYYNKKIEKDRIAWEKGKALFYEEAARIEKEIARAKENVDSWFKSYSFSELQELRHRSIEVADHAYASFEMHKSIVRETLQQRRNVFASKNEQKDYLNTNRLPKEEYEVCIANIRALSQVIGTLNEILASREKEKQEFLTHVRTFNHRTHAINELIRDTCGAGGRRWYELHQQRKLKNNI